MEPGRMQGKDEAIKLSGGQRENKKEARSEDEGAPHERHITSLS